MTQFVFGSGTLIMKRTDLANTPPALLGTLQDLTIDFDRKIESLLGQYNVAVALGGGEEGTTEHIITEAAIRSLYRHYRQVMDL